MSTAADDRFAGLLVQSQVLPAESVRQEQEVAERVRALGLVIDLARVMTERGTLGAEPRKRFLALPLSEADKTLLAGHLASLQRKPAPDRRLGELAAQHGLVAKAQVDEALALQHEAQKLGVQKRLGDVLVERSWLAAEVVRALVEVQDAIAAQKDPKRKGTVKSIVAPSDLVFCAIASANRLAGPAQLQKAILAQRRLYQRLQIRRPVGEVLLGLRVIAPEGLLATQRLVRARLRDADPAEFEAVLTTDDQEAKIGEILHATKTVRAEQVAECIQIQRVMRELGLSRRIGEILVMKGYLDLSALDALLDVQDHRRKRGRDRRVKRARTDQTVMASMIVAGVIAVVGLLFFALRSGKDDAPRRVAQTSPAPAAAAEPAAPAPPPAAEPQVPPPAAPTPTEPPAAPETPPEVPPAPAVEPPAAPQSPIPTDLWDVASEQAVLATTDRIEGLARSGRFADASSEAAQATKGAHEGPFHSYLQSWSASLAELGQFQGRLIAALSKGTVKLQGLSELPGLAGKIAEADATGFSVAVQGGARLQKPWTSLSAASFAKVASAALGPRSPQLAADVALWSIEFAPGDDAERAWAEASSVGADLAAFSIFHDRRLWSSERAQLAEALDRVRQAERGQPLVAVLDAFQALRGRFSSCLGLDLAPVDAEEKAYLVRAVPEALDAARGLARKGDATAALERLAPLRHRLASTEFASQVEAAWQEAAREFVAPLADFDRAQDVAAVQSAPGEGTAWEGTGTLVHAGAGSLRWAFGGSNSGGWSLPGIPRDWSKWAWLSIWIHCDRAGRGTIYARAESTPDDAFDAPIALDWTGWKRVRIALARMRAQRTPDLSRITTLTFWRFEADPGVTLHFDEIRLEAAKVPSVLGAEEPPSATTTPPPTPAPPSDPPPAADPRPPDPAPPVRPNPPPATPKSPPPDPTVKGGHPSSQHWVSLENGIALIPPDKWAQIPSPKEDVDGWARADGIESVTRFEAKNPDPDYFSINLDVFVVAHAASIDEAIQTYVKGAYLSEGPTDVAPIRIGPWTARSFQAANRHFFKNVFVVFDGGRAAVMVFTSGEKYGKKKVDVFRQTAQTFLFVSSDDLARLKSKNRGAPVLAEGWSSFQTAHYEIEYNCEKEFAQLVGKHLEAILKEYQHRFPMDATLDEMGRETGKVRRFTVKVFKTEAEFQSYAATNGVGGAAAYFSSSQEELVCYKFEEGKKVTFNVLYHEASHQYMYLYMGPDVTVPSWLDEGVGDYFFGGRFEPDGSFHIRENSWRRETIKDAVRINKHVPLKEIFHYTQAQYYSNADLCYAEGWAIAYFLWTTKDPKYVGRLDRFYATLKATKDSDKALQQAFGDLDMDKLEEDWKEFVHSL